MKQILISLSIISVVGSLVISGTIAQFRDEERITGNVFQAGTLDLTVDDKNTPGLTIFNFSNIASSEKGFYSWKLKNVGTLTGFLDLSSISVIEDGGLHPEAERVIDTDNSGDLGETLHFQVWFDTNNNKIINEGEIIIHDEILDDFEVALYDIDKRLAAGAITYLTLRWELPADIRNKIQGDEAKVHFTIELDQFAD